MKKLSKIVALLLAGVMAMVMLTACSGGGTDTDEKKQEMAFNTIRCPFALFALPETVIVSEFIFFHCSSEFCCPLLRIL